MLEIGEFSKRNRRISASLVVAGNGIFCLANGDFGVND